MMSYVGLPGNSQSMYRASEQSAVLNRNMLHLRDNSGDRSFDKVDLTKKNKMSSHRKRTQSTAENILKTRFPNLAAYKAEDEQDNRSKDSHKDSIRLQKVEKWVGQDVINEEKAARDKPYEESEDEEKQAKPKQRSQTSTKKIDTHRLIKPTYSSLK